MTAGDILPSPKEQRRHALAAVAEKLDDLSVELLRLGVPEVANTLCGAIERLREVAEASGESPGR